MVSSPASDEMDDLDRVAVAERRRRVGGARDDLAVQLDRDAAWSEAERRDQVRDRRARRQTSRLVVHRDVHHGFVVLRGPHRGERPTISAPCEGDNGWSRWYENFSPSFDAVHDTRQ